MLLSDFLRLKTMILLQVLALTLCMGLSLGWVNNYDQRFTFNCPTNQYISRIQSVHSNKAEDRRWSFSCTSSNLGICSSSNGPVNHWDQPLSYTCPNNGVLVGMGGEHDNRREDRLFWFRCCQLSGPQKPIHNCHWTYYVNDWDAVMDFRVPSEFAIRGVSSVHDNGKEDRRWKFYICRIANNNCA